MTVRQVTAAKARAWFEHPSQLAANGLDSADQLPDEGCEYWACGDICALFHRQHWPDVWGVHCGVKPEGWGKLAQPALAILRAFQAYHEPSLICAWSKESNRAILAFNRRIGFKIHGYMPTPDGRVVLQHWEA